jgi:hypothetical protein
LFRMGGECLAGVEVFEVKGFIGHWFFLGTRRFPLSRE